MLHAFPPNCFSANIAGTLVSTESNAMSPCSPLAASTQLFSQGAIESQLDFGCDFDGKSAENHLKIGGGSAFPPNSVGESLWGAFWPRFSRFGLTFGRSGGASGDPGPSLGRLRAPQDRPKCSHEAPRSTQDRPSRPKIEPEATQVGRKSRLGTDFGLIFGAFRRFLVDFSSISVPKLLPKRFRRHARRRLLFDGVFDASFDQCCALSRRTAFSPTSLGHCVLPSQTLCRHVRRLPLRPNFLRKARSNRD